MLHALQTSHCEHSSLSIPSGDRIRQMGHCGFFVGGSSEYGAIFFQTCGY